MTIFSRSFLATAFMFLSVNCWAMNINQYHSGSWNNRSQSGHGFSFEVLDEDTLLIYWYVYNPDRTSTFLLTVAQINGSTASGPTYYYSGMKFGEFNPNDVNEQNWGTVSITFHDCENATLLYSSTMSQGGVAFGSGTIQLTRLLAIDKMQCSNSPYAGLYQGYFLSEATDSVFVGWAILAPNGQGVSVSLGGIATFGTWSANNGTINMSGSAISLDANNYSKANFSANGVIEEDHRMVTNYTVTGGDFGIANFYATTALYRRGANLADITGNYTGQNLVTGVEANISIAANGSVSGSDITTTCTYGGQIQIPDPRFNILRVTVNVSNCGVSNGQYIGYGMVDDFQSLGDGRMIILAATNGTYAAVVQLTR